MLAGLILGTILVFILERKAMIAALAAGMGRCCPLSA